jgi:hypothetical protein
MVRKWKDVPIKEKIQYWVSTVLILSGIVLSYLSFFLSDNKEINDSVLIYLSQTLVFAGGVFGVSLYFKSQISEFRTKSKEYIDKIADAKLGKPN